MQQNPPCPLPAGAVVHESKAGNIRDEIGIPRSMRLNFPALAAEVSLFPGEAIGKLKRVVEDEIQIAESIDHDRRVRQGQQSRRLGALGVEMLAPGIERRRKHAAFVPLESLLAPIGLPNARRASTFDDVDKLLE